MRVYQMKPLCKVWILSKMGLIVTQSEDPTVRVVFNTEDKKVVGYRCADDNYKLPKYMEIRDKSYVKIGKGGAIDVDSPKFVRVRVKGKLVMKPYEEYKRRSVIASCTNPKADKGNG